MKLQQVTFAVLKTILWYVALVVVSSFAQFNYTAPSLHLMCPALGSPLHTDLVNTYT